MIALTIDCGNTSSKAVVWKDGNVEESFIFPLLNADILVPLFEKWKPWECGLCITGDFDVRLIETLRSLVDDRFFLLTPGVRLPFSIDYRSKKTLGPDRIAGAYGAYRISGGVACLIADCGTALTLDVVDGKGNFRGGNIAPGLSLRLKSLHEATSRLPLVPFSGDVPSFGYDTDTAIRSGVVLGMADEVEGAFLRAKALYGASSVVMTGGSCGPVFEILSQSGLPVVQDEFLVARGLLGIMDYNFSL